MQRAPEGAYRGMNGKEGREGKAINTGCIIKQASIDGPQLELIPAKERLQPV